MQVLIYDDLLMLKGLSCNSQVNAFNLPFFQNTAIDAVISFYFKIQICLILINILKYLQTNFKAVQSQKKSIK